MTKVLYRPPRRPQWWYLRLAKGAVVERDGQSWTLATAFGDKVWVETPYPKREDAL